jgi:hypothetical protein
MRSLNLFTIAITILIAGITSCKKEEGFGGNGKISGKLYYKLYDSDFKVSQGESPAMDKDIYILFGNESFSGDNVKASSDGSFEFNFLLPGEYTIYSYGDDTTKTLPFGKAVYSKKISISKGEDKNIGNFYLKKGMAYNEGTGTIIGTLMVRNYQNGFSILKDITPGQSEDVYLVYNNHNYFDERFRTFYDGTFMFRNLIYGTYKIYAYSDDLSGSSAKVPIIKEVTINKEVKTVDIGTLFIDKK